MMLSDALSDFTDCIQIAIINLSNSLEFYEENDELFGYGTDLTKLIEMCKLIQVDLGQSDALDLKLFEKLYETAHSTRVRHDATYWSVPSDSTEADTPVL